LGVANVDFSPDVTGARDMRAVSAFIILYERNRSYEHFKYGAFFTITLIPHRYALPESVIAGMIRGMRLSFLQGKSRNQ
jgi:hypothetical protein